MRNRSFFVTVPGKFRAACITMEQSNHMVEVGTTNSSAAAAANLHAKRICSGIGSTFVKGKINVLIILHNKPNKGPGLS